MDEINLAILGARGKIGQYHVIRFGNANAKIHAILGRNTKENQQFAGDTYRHFGGEKPRVYVELDDLLRMENKLNTISIATPAILHEDQVRKSLNAGFHVFCEKPFILNPDNNNYVTSKELFELAESKGLILTVNTQWPSIIPKIKDYIPENITSFSFYGEPDKFGIDMIPEAVPHANSLLIEIIGTGKADNINYIIKEDEELKIEFDFITNESICKVHYHLKHKKERPREFWFKINDKKFIRIFKENYNQVFMLGDLEISIEDPLKVSIEKFISAVKGTGDTLVSTENTLNNIMIQDQILIAHSNSV